MQRTCDLSSGWSVNQVVRQRELRRVEEIENLPSQFELTALFEFEVLKMEKSVS